MRSAMAWLRFLRMFLYWVLLGELLSLGFTMILAEGIPESTGSFQFPVWSAVRIAAVLFAIHFMDRRPVPGSGIVAVLYTLVFASTLQLVAEDQSFFPRDLIRPGFWMACSWVTVVQALRDNLARRHKQTGVLLATGTFAALMLVVILDFEFSFKT